MAYTVGGHPPRTGWHHSIKPASLKICADVKNDDIIHAPRRYDNVYYSDFLGRQSRLSRIPENGEERKIGDWLGFHCGYRDIKFPSHVE